ncbi:MAG: hypothetical protein KDE51_03870 [Anaerolineales bacterium]|nr:hypothetical protein [Anaerolineales bacterium]
MESAQPLPKHMIQADKRLSHSLLWEIQRRYFLQAGISAWQEDVVPHQISCNPFMARAYADVVFGYLRDCAAAGLLDRKRPLYIIELGAGSGRLTYHFLHHFYERFLESPFAGLPVKFILTDFVPAILEFWQNHPQLRPWVEEDLLDFALFDVAQMAPLTLLHSGKTLTPDQVSNPLILLANYFFDSIPQDSFVIEEGELQENLLTLYSSQPEPDLNDPTIWERLVLAYEPLPLQTPYEVDAYNQILAGYEAELPDTVLSFPKVGLDCIRFWEQFGRVLLLTADRGYALFESLAAQDDPLPNLHGSFSMMVNYHAISEYVWLQDGEVCQAPHYQDNMQVLAYLIGEIPKGGLETFKAFDTAVVNGGPDDFFAIKQVVEQHSETMTLPQLLSFLRWSGYDADVFRDCYEALVKQTAAADAVWHADVAAVVEKVREQYLPLHTEDEFEAQLMSFLQTLDTD